MSCHRRDDCRLCESTRLVEVLTLAPTPPANAFVPADQKDRSQETFPLSVFFCEECGHVQLRDVVDPEVLFSSYVYVSGTSPVFVDHFRRYAEAAIEQLGGAEGLVVDVGSNDGTLLGFFKEAGMSVLGVDPAEKIAAEATRKGIETLPVFFDADVADSIRKKHGAATLVTANNVFAHADDLRGFVEGVRRLLARGGLFRFEVGYLVDVFEKTLFDTIYHEHLAYHSVGPLARFFDAVGMQVIDVERLDVHGGSIRGTAQLEGGPRPVSRSVEELAALEHRIGLDRAATFAGFSERIDAIGKELRSKLEEIRRQGARVAGFGAPAKATTLMHHFEIDRTLIDFIVDDSPLKQGLLTPGFHVPVLPSSAIYDRSPDFVVVLAWNFAKPIMEKHARFREEGGHFIVPLPSVEVI